MTTVKTHRDVTAVRDSLVKAQERLTGHNGQAAIEAAQKMLDVCCWLLTSALATDERAEVKGVGGEDIADEAKGWGAVCGHCRTVISLGQVHSPWNHPDAPRGDNSCVVVQAKGFRKERQEHKDDRIDVLSLIEAAQAMISGRMGFAAYSLGGQVFVMKPSVRINGEKTVILTPAPTSRVVSRKDAAPDQSKTRTDEYSPFNPPPEHDIFRDGWRS